MTDAQPVPAHAMFKVLAALGELGEATAAAVADKAGLGYSTATAKLRAWEQTGLAERIRTEDNRAVWRLTDTGRATVGADRAALPTHTADDVLPGEPAQATADTPDAPAVTADAAEPPEQPAPEPDNPAGGGQPVDSAAPPDAPAPPGGDEERTPSADGDAQQAEPAPDRREPEAGAESAGSGTSTARSRRTKGSLRGAVLDILEAHPDRAYKTSDLCKLIDAANAGTDAKKASAGAVVNAADKLVNDGKAVRTVDKPATFQLAPANP